MESRKKDRRSIVTEQRIKTEIIHYLIKNPQKKPSISFIMDELNLNRNTFYLHFTNMNEFYVSLEKEVLDFFISYLHFTTFEEFLSNFDKVFFKVSKDLFSHPYLKEVIFDVFGHENYLKQITKILIEYFYQLFLEEIKDRNPVFLYPFSFYIYGYFYALKSYYDHPQCDLEAFLTQLLSNIKKGLIRSYKDVLYR